jgi:DNA-binding winged helix-turn-helix (wHTH) protein
MRRRSPSPIEDAQPSRVSIGSGAFTFDRQTRQLVARGGETLHLTPKAFELLEILIAETPRVVPKTELHERLWPETFVSDATLAGLVKELRRVLRAHAPDMRFIRTAHSVGFAFCAPVTASHVPDGIGNRCWLIARGRRVWLKPGDNIIGRDPACDVWLNAPSVSRRHARIVVDGASARIEDLDSKNGTRLANSPVTAPVTLNDGDEVQIGRFSIVYREASQGSTESLHERFGESTD